ncbi:MAG: tetratricopeptide repeat protein [Syntrophales bacterium]|nr:tetratricopeptide repeat protein [Syntrophales bacterium]
MATAGKLSLRRSLFTRNGQGVLQYSLVIAALVFIVYANTFHVPFIFDDRNIVDNRSIHDLLSVSHVFAPPFETGIAGRPIVNLSLALNYAISGMNPWSYHLLNLLIHLSAALCLFGIVRRSFLSDRLKGKYGHAATPLSFACALLWALHPLQTQAVTYTIQRCESLMGLCFLLTFYLAIQGWQSAAPRRLHLTAVLSFLIGVGTKETIVIAPFLLFVYDLLFFHGDPRNVLRRSPLLYTGLFFGLLSLGLLVSVGGTISSGAGRMTFSAIDYWLTQPEVILHYLRLTFWPDRLCIDYGWPITKFGDAWPSIIVISALIAASAWALWKQLPIGFLSLWFFAILAPTSLIPLPDVAFEHRMYLPSIAIVVFTITGVYRLLNGVTERLIENEALKSMVMRKGSFYMLILAGIMLGITTFARNIDYQSDISIWADAVKKCSGNSRAHLNLGVALMARGDYENSILHYKEAIRIKPDYAIAHTNLGNALMGYGKIEEAIEHFRRFLKMRPHYSPAQRSLADALLRKGEYDESVFLYNKVLQLEPNNPELYNNLGVALASQRNIELAVHSFKLALKINPGYAEARNNLQIVMKHINRHR